MKNYSNIENIYKDFIYPVFNKISTSINDKQKNVFKRSHNLTLSDLFYFMCVVNVTNFSYKHVIDKTIASNLINYSITDSATTKRKNKISYEFFNQNNSDLLECVYDNISVLEEEQYEYRLLGVDVSIFHVEESFTKDNVIKSNNNHCCKLLLSCLFDLDRKILVRYHLNKNSSEIEALREYLHLLDKKDIVVHDAYYYRDDLLYNYNKYNVNAIFNMKKNYIKTKDFIRKHGNIFNSNKKDATIKLTIENKIIDFRLIKYRIRNNKGVFVTYILGTTLTDKEKISYDFIKESYHKRWNIEVHFKQLKENTAICNFKTKTYDGILKDIQVICFVNILVSYITYILNKTILKKESNKQIHYKNCFDFVTDELLKNIFFKKESAHDNNIKIIELISKNVSHIKENRNFPRIRKRPNGKWTISGTTSNRSGKEKKKQKLIERKKERSTKMSNYFYPLAINIDCG